MRVAVFEGEEENPSPHVHIVFHLGIAKGWRTSTQSDIPIAITKWQIECYVFHAGKSQFNMCINITLI